MENKAIYKENSKDIFKTYALAVVLSQVSLRAYPEKVAERFGKVRKED